MNADVEDVCGRVIAALLTGGYQGLLLTGLIWMVLVAMRRSSAATRHNICLVTLFLVALLPVAQFARSNVSTKPLYGEKIRNWIESAKSLLGADRTSTDIVLGKTIIATAIPENAENGSPTATESIFQKSTAEQRISHLSEIPTLDQNIQNFEVTPPPIAAEYGQLKESSSFTVPVNLPKRAGVWLVAAATAIVLVRLVALSWQLLAILRLKRRGQNPDEQSETHFKHLCTEMKLRRATKLIISQEGAGPCAAGFWRPAVLAPQSVLRGGTEGAESILRHELAHIARGDDWASLFQQVIAALFFFHPAVWMLSRRLNEEREIACDDHVLAARPNRKQYALLLTEFATQSAVSRWTAAPAAWNSKSQLKRRIDMILNKKRNTSPRAGRVSVGIVSATALIAAITAIGFAPQVAFAQSSQGRTLVSPDGALLTLPEIEDGAPRVKASGGAVIAAAPAPHAFPAPAAVSVAGPLVAVAPEPPAHAAHPPAPRKARASGDADGKTLERRLERLERMVEELAGREKGGKEKELSFSFAHPKPDVNVNVDHFKFDEKEMAKMQKEIARSVREVEKVAREMGKGHSDGAYVDGKPAEAAEIHLKAQRQALEAQRKNLERELRSIKQRIEALDRDKERAEERRERVEKQEKEKVISKEKSLRKEAQNEAEQEETSEDNRKQ